jgi:hypothetical protein
VFTQHARWVYPEASEAGQHLIEGLLERPIQRAEQIEEEAEEKVFHRHNAGR